MNIPVKMKAMVLTNPGKWEITEARCSNPGSRGGPLPD